MSTEPNWTPEPWETATLERSRACVNACASIQDPAAEIARLRSLAAAGEKVANALAAVLDVSPHEFFQTMLAGDAKAALKAYHAAKSQSEPTAHAGRE